MPAFLINPRRQRQVDPCFVVGLNISNACSSLSKRGFGIPLAAWLRTTWRKQSEEALFEGSLISEGFIEREPLIEIWNAHQSRHSDYSYLLWTLLMLSLFLEEYE